MLRFKFRLLTTTSREKKKKKIEYIKKSVTNNFGYMRKT